MSRVQNLFDSLAGVPYSVSGLNQYIAFLMDEDAELKHIQVSGEISGMKIYTSSGHGYFSLKDNQSSISCVIFSRWLQKLAFQPQDGMQVIISGSISVYEKQGRYQLYAEDIQPAGLGEYYLKLEELKQKLEAEGLFELARKRPLPVRASRIGIITSLYGAALRDMVRILRLRQPGVHIVVVHSLVQGPQAPDSLQKALVQFNRYGKVDIILLGRGGGSAEDLQAFNDEKVVRAVSQSKIPVIAAVGHESDFSLTDFVADVRAATPTQAAQLAVPEDEELMQAVVLYQYKLENRMRRKLNQAQLEIDEAAVFLQKYGKKWIIKQRNQALTAEIHRIHRAVQSNLTQKKQNLEKTMIKFKALNPTKILHRGYACILREDNKYIYQADSVQEKEKLWIQMKDGKIQVQVLKKEIHEKN